MFSADRFLERSGARAAAIFAMYLILAEFLLSMILIWASELLPGRRASAEEEIWSTMLAVGAVGVSALMCLRLWPKPAMRVACGFGLVCAIVSLCFFIVAIWGYHNGRYQTRDAVGATGGWIAAAGILSVLCLLGFPLDRRHWRWIGVLAAFGAAGMAIYFVWQDRRHWPFIFTIAATVAMVVAHANATMFAELKEGQQWLRWLTFAAVLATAALADASIYEERNASDFLQRVSIAAAVCAACATLAMVILSRANVKPELRQASRELMELTVICPRCNKKQTLRIGDTECAGCGLRFSIKVEEPRCPTCDYLLYGLTSDRCPECGTMIRPTVLTPG